MEISIENTDEAISWIEESLKLDDPQEMHKRLDVCKREIVKRGIRFSHEQVEFLFDSILAIFKTPNLRVSFPLFEMILTSSDYEVKTQMELSSENMRDDQMWELGVDIIKRGGIISEDENVLYFDYVKAFYNEPGLIAKKDSWRDGFMYLTDRRIILVGYYIFMNYGRSTGYQIFYDDWETMPYIRSIDFIEYDRMKSIKPIWKFTDKGIKIAYDTKYTKSKNRFIYGPFNLKLNLDPDVRIEKGQLDIKIEAHPKEIDRKERHQKTVAKLRELTGL